jgi:hypothetical protein
LKDIYETPEGEDVYVPAEYLGKICIHGKNDIYMYI